MSFQEQNQVNSWKTIQIWIDKTAHIPYVLLLLENVAGQYKVCDPAENYSLVESFDSYNEAKKWLLEDEYESACEKNEL